MSVIAIPRHNARGLLPFAAWSLVLSAERREWRVSLLRVWRRLVLPWERRVSALRYTRRTRRLTLKNCLSQPASRLSPCLCSETRGYFFLLSWRDFFTAALTSAIVTFWIVIVFFAMSIVSHRLKPIASPVNFKLHHCLRAATFDNRRAQA